MPRIGVVIINYRRPDNLPPIIAALRRQTINPTIIVIDNSGTMNKIDGADVLLSSSFNFNCLPRYFVPGWLELDFVMQHDDDHVIREPDFLERLVEESERYPKQALCYNGRILDPGEKAYQDGKEVTGPQDCVVCNFGFSFYPAVMGNLLPSAPFNLDITFEEMRYADDMFASAFMHPRVSAVIRPGLDKLPEGPEEHTLSKSSRHMDARNAVCRRLFQVQPE